MARWIDAEWLKEKQWQVESEAHFDELIPVVSVEDIDEAPSIDIVRCKECKWFDTDNTGETYCMSAKGLCDVNADDYCSYGERRE